MEPEVVWLKPRMMNAQAIAQAIHRYAVEQTEYEPAKINVGVVVGRYAACKPLADLVEPELQRHLGSYSDEDISLSTVTCWHLGDGNFGIVATYYT